MWIENEVYLNDLKTITADENVPFQQLEGKTIFVTGATGLIGSTLVNSILYYGLTAKVKPRVIALVRSTEKAQRMFAPQIAAYGDAFSFIEGSVEGFSFPEGPVDYIVHAASQTASAAFVATPVETIETSVLGTMNVLKLAKEKNVQGLVYLSSMEVYGTPLDDTPITEQSPAYFDCMDVRCCYPESKRMCESLCSSYAHEYGIPCKVVRLSQTFGPGVTKTDGRVFAYFARCAMNGESIVLATTGESKRTYVYTFDAVSAIITVLIKGLGGEAYNIANAETYCSIIEMAHMVGEQLADPPVDVKIVIDNEASKIFNKPHALCIEAAKLEQLGWCPTTGWLDMYKKMIACY